MRLYKTGSPIPDRPTRAIPLVSGRKSILAVDERLRLLSLITVDGVSSFRLFLQALSIDDRLSGSGAMSSPCLSDR